MTTITLNTLSYIKKLRNAGVPDKLAEVQIEMTAEFMKETLEDKFATKHDLQLLKTSIHRDLCDLKSELKQDIANLTIKMAYMSLGSATIFGAIVKLISLI